MRTFAICASLSVITLLAIPTLGQADPIGLAPGSPASANLTPLALDDKDNPLHLTDSEQFHINARKLKFEKDATTVMNNTKLTGPQRQLKIESLESIAKADILAMLDHKQLAIVNQLDNANKDQAGKEIQGIERRQTLATLYIRDKERLLKSMTPAQTTQLLSVERTWLKIKNKIITDPKLTAAQKVAKLKHEFPIYDQQRTAVLTHMQRMLVMDMNALNTKARSMATQQATPAAAH